MNIVITGAIRERDLFFKEFKTLLETTKPGVVNKIVVVTWKDQQTHFFEEIVPETITLKIIKLNPKIRYLRPKTSYQFQRVLFKTALLEVPNGSLAIKIRTDIYLHPNLVNYLNNLSGLKEGEKIWVPNFSPENWGSIADTAFCGTKELLTLLYEPAGLKFSTRSANGMKSHLDTWSGYLNNKDQNLIKLINWKGSYFSIKNSFKFFLIAMDLFSGDVKSSLWLTREKTLLNYSNYRLIILWYRQRLNSILIVGTCKGVDNVYIRRVGQDFHKNATYSEGSGNFVSESLLIESKSDLGLKNIHEIIAQINFKKVTREIKKKFKDQSKKLSIFYYFRPISRPHYNYLKSAFKIAISNVNIKFGIER